MEKYHKTDIYPVEKENERDENYEASNPQINSERTKDNYHTFARYCSYTEFINKRIAELNLPTKPRKDAVLMASFVIGSDGEFFKGLTPAEQEDFFAQCTRYFADKYGKENIISAVVHNDETTPHLHLNLMPIRNWRLCCKDLFNRAELTKLQTDFHEAVGKRWGLERGREGSPKKHLSTAEYKAKKIVLNACTEAADITETAQSELRQINQAVKKAEEHFDETIGQIHTAKAERDKIVAERDSEADYSQALEQAKNGEIAHGKRNASCCAHGREQKSNRRKHAVKERQQLSIRVLPKGKENTQRPRQSTTRYYTIQNARTRSICASVLPCYFGVTTFLTHRRTTCTV